MKLSELISCQPCPNNFVCESKGLAFPSVPMGFFRGQNYSPDFMIKCIPEEACLPTIDDQFETTCSTGYTVSP